MGGHENAAGVVLVAVDGSENSILAAGVGARLARMLHARLGLLHVLDVPPLNFWAGVESRMKEDIRTQAEANLTAVAQRISRVCNLTPYFCIVEGLPDEEIARVAAEDPGTLMVIVGRNGIAAEKHSNLGMRHQIGGLTHKLARQLPVPLLVIPPDLHPSHICPSLAEAMLQDDDSSA